MQRNNPFLRICSLALTILFAFTLFTACGTADSSSTETSDTESVGLFPPSEEDVLTSEGDKSDSVSEDGSSDTGSTASTEDATLSESIPTDKPEDSDNPGTSSNTEQITTPSAGFAAQTSIPYGKLGLRAIRAESSNSDVAIGKALSGTIAVYGYTSGTATLTAVDYFGFEAKIDVTVDAEAKKITYTPRELPNFIEVGIDFGAKGNGTTDDTKAFQNALDSAKPGETVYVYPGRYAVSLLTMPEGVTLQMYTTMTDAKSGFNGKIMSDFITNKIAVLSGTRILNVKNNTPGRNGNNNFKIIGGAIDLNLTDRSTLIFGNAKNITVENVIFKDIKNNHVIQLTGCVNATVKNCMFAGFVCGNAFTREIIQVEPSAPGATGTAETAPITFADGEYYLPENITITDCYFGKSNEAGAPLTAIGHHSQVGGANVTNFKITNNVFDECLYAAIRYNNFVNVEITGNTFRSTAAYKNATQYEDAKEPAFIQLYHYSRNITYANEKGTNVTRAKADEQAGLHNVRIENNTFEVGQGADKKILRYVGTGKGPGAFYTTGNRQDTYLGETYFLKGYRPVNNYASNISFADNTITFTGKPTYTDWYISLDPIYNLNVSNNKVNLASGLSFSKGTNGQVIKTLSETQQRTFTVAMGNSAKTVTLVCGAQRYTFTATASATATFLMSEGGDLPLITADKEGNLTVTLNPKSGYSFDKITASGGTALSAATTVSSSTQFNVLFKK